MAIDHRIAALTAPLLLGLSSSSWAGPDQDGNGSVAPLYALVIGNNHPLPGSEYEPLQYADDDAIRFARFFDSLGAKVILLTQPDADTVDHYGARLRGARAPTRKNLERAVDEIEAALSAAEGLEPEFFFYFSGHGSVTSSEAYLHLLGSKFARIDLHELVLRRLPAHRIHVVIDSCHSYFMVNPRGTRVETALEEESLDQYPGAGFLLSTSSQREVHEWQGYRGGVFSHQLLGALQGAADVDIDGRVTYSEAHSYLINANRDVQNPYARVQPFVRRPISSVPTVLDLRRAQPETRAWVPTDVDGHFFVTDQHGTRLLDGNKAAGDLLELALPFGVDPLLHIGGRVYGVEVGPSGERLLRRALREESRTALSSKGAISDDLRKNLFKRPLTRAFVEGLDAAERFSSRKVIKLRHRAPYWLDDPATLGLIGSGAAFTLAGLGASFPFLAAQNEANDLPVTQHTADAQARAQRWQAVMITGYAVGGAVLTLGVLRALFVNGPRRSPVEVAITPVEGGLAVSAGGILW